MTSQYSLINSWEKVRTINRIINDFGHVFNLISSISTSCYNL